MTIQGGGTGWGAAMPVFGRPASPRNLYPQNGEAVAHRRRSGARLVALAVAVDRPTAGKRWLGSEDVDWIGIIGNGSLSIYELPMVAGLTCLVFGRRQSRRPFAAIDRLYRAGADSVWLECDDGFWCVPPPVPGKPVNGVDGPLTDAQVISLARAARLQRGAA